MTMAHPLVIISHGTGGVTESLSWLARGLVEAGYIVAGVNHHGNCGGEPYLAEGFMCWWERARDTSVFLDYLLRGPLSDFVDTDRIAHVGFSLGGYTGLALAGGRTSMAAWEAFQATLESPMRGPKEFEGMANELEGLAATSLQYQASMARHADVYTETRIKSVVTIAAAPPLRALTEASVKAIGTPVTLVTSGADTKAPKEQCADWLKTQNPTFRYYDVGDDVGHYTFLGEPTNPALKTRLDIFQDRPGVVRAEVQQDTLDIVRATLASDLA